MFINKHLHMDSPHIECRMCKMNIDHSSNFITIRYDKGNVYFHRFCYFNYRMKASMQ